MQLFFIIALLFGLVFTVNVSSDSISESSATKNIYAEVPINVEGIDEFDERGNNYIIRSALTGNIEAMKNYIKAGADLNLANEEGNTALLLAAKNNLYDICRELMKAGADIEHKNKLGISALMISVILGHKYLVQTILDHGAHPDTKMADDSTALMIACQKGRDEIISLLLARGASIHARSVQGTTVLMSACMSRQVSTVSLILAAKPDIDAKTDESSGGTALMYASSRGMDDIIELLIKAEANIALKDRLGRTAMQIAIDKRQQSSINMLAIYGAALPRSGYRISSEVLRERSRRLQS